MTWTYSERPDLVKLDEVRFLLSDTTENRPLLSDEEITYLLGVHKDHALSAAFYGSEQIIRKLTSKGKTRLGRFEFDPFGLAKEMRNIQTALQRRLSSQKSNFHVGGLSKDGKKVYQEDLDIVQPRFHRGQHANKTV